MAYNHYQFVFRLVHRSCEFMLALIPVHPTCISYLIEVKGGGQQSTAAIPKLSGG